MPQVIKRSGRELTITVPKNDRKKISSLLKLMQKKGYGYYRKYRSSSHFHPWQAQPWQSAQKIQPQKSTKQAKAKYRYEAYESENWRTYLIAFAAMAGLTAGTMLWFFSPATALALSTFVYGAGSLFAGSVLAFLFTVSAIYLIAELADYQNLLINLAEMDVVLHPKYLPYSPRLREEGLDAEQSSAGHLFKAWFIGIDNFLISAPWLAVQKIFWGIGKALNFLSFGYTVEGSLLPHLALPNYARNQWHISQPQDDQPQEIKPIGIVQAFFNDIGFYVSEIGRFISQPISLVFAVIAGTGSVFSLHQVGKAKDNLREIEQIKTDPYEAYFKDFNPGSPAAVEPLFFGTDWIDGDDSDNVDAAELIMERHNMAPNGEPLVKHSYWGSTFQGY